MRIMLTRTGDLFFFFLYNFQGLVNDNEIVPREIKVKLSKSVIENLSLSLEPFPTSWMGVETGLLGGCQSQPCRSIQLLDLSVVLENVELLRRVLLCSNITDTMKLD